MSRHEHLLALVDDLTYRPPAIPSRWPADIEPVKIHTFTTAIRIEALQRAAPSLRQHLETLPEAVDGVRVGSLHRQMSYLAIAAILEGRYDPDEAYKLQALRLGALGKHAGILSIWEPKDARLDWIEEDQHPISHQDLANAGHIYFQLIPAEQ